MAIKPWVTVATTDKDGESVVNENLVKLFHDNQEALITGPVDCRWDEISEDTSFPFVLNEEVFIPESCNSTDEDVVLVVRFQKKVAGGTTGQVRITLGSGSAVTSSTFVNTAYDTIEIELVAADVRAVAGTIAALKIELLRTAGSGLVYAENKFSSSRIERRL